MHLLDTYAKLSGEERTIGLNVIIVSPIKLIESWLKNKSKEFSEIEIIRFVKSIPNSVVESVNNEFGNVYIENKNAYIINISEKEINVYSQTEQGLFGGFVCLIRHIENGRIRQGHIYNVPLINFRGAKVYIPSRENIPFFKEFIDFCAYYGYNKLMIEVGGAMEYKKHPEINSGWIDYCKRFQEYQGQAVDVQNGAKWAKNSNHIENGGGSYLLQEEVQELVQYCYERYIEVIPEVPSYSHSDYLLTNHPELAERKEDDYPDTYCPSNTKCYELLFDVLDEVIAVFSPKIINIGHDELYSICLCENCKNKKAYKHYAEDIIKIHDYLADKNIKTAIWGDKLLNAIGRKGQTWGGSQRIIVNLKTGDFLEIVPSTYQAIDMIPIDIEIFHWYWNIDPKFENEFLNRGFKTILGNFNSQCMDNWLNRVKRGIKGICVSNWSVPDKDHMQRNGIFFKMAYAAMMAWNLSFKEEEYTLNSVAVSSDIYQYHNKDYKNFMEVKHRTTLFKEHKPYGDGICIDKEEDYLGKYIIIFESGKTKEVLLYYGLNIGISKADWNRKQDENTFGYSCNGQQEEATYSCKLVVDGDEIYYKYSIEIPCSERVKSVKCCTDSKYGNVIDLKEIHYKSNCEM